MQLRTQRNFSFPSRKLRSFNAFLSISSMRIHNRTERSEFFKKWNCFHLHRILGIPNVAARWLLLWKLSRVLWDTAYAQNYESGQNLTSLMWQDKWILERAFSRLSYAFLIMTAVGIDKNKNWSWIDILWQLLTRTEEKPCILHIAIRPVVSLACSGKRNSSGLFHRVALITPGLKAA